MQIGYRCKNCKYVHNSIVSSCDCESSHTFEYTKVAIHDLPQTTPEVPDITTLDYTQDDWHVNVPGGQYGNGVYAYTGPWQEYNARFGHETVAHVMGTGQHLDRHHRADRKNERANLVLVSGANRLLEACYMALAYFELKQKVQGSSPRNSARIAVLKDAIVKATDQSPLDVRHTENK